MICLVAGTRGIHQKFHNSGMFLEVKLRLYLLLKCRSFWNIHMSVNWGTRGTGRQETKITDPAVLWCFTHSIVIMILLESTLMLHSRKGSSEVLKITFQRRESQNSKEVFAMEPVLDPAQQGFPASSDDYSLQICADTECANRRWLCHI